MWQLELTDSQAVSLQKLIHLGLKQVAATGGLPDLIEATKAAEELLALPKKVEAESE